MTAKELLAAVVATWQRKMARAESLKSHMADAISDEELDDIRLGLLQAQIDLAREEEKTK